MKPADDIAARPEAARSERLTILDSFRAIAALLVILYHYFHRWAPGGGAPADLLPFVPFVSDNALVSTGRIGVDMFFVISGFVIFFTLTRTKTVWDFAVARFARLFPAMLVCALLTLVIARILGVAPFSDVSAVDLIPSLLFTQPAIINKITGLDTHYVSGVYWSLFVEIKFYTVAALLYYAWPRHFLRNFAAVSGALFVAWFFSDVDARKVIELLTFAKYAPFFVAGVTLYNAYKNGFSAPTAALLMASYILGVVRYIDEPNAMTFAADVTAIFLLFLVFVMRPAWIGLLQNRMLVSIGTASYSLYLIHESIGISILSLMPRNDLFPIYALSTIAAAIGFSLLICRFVEIPARRLIVGKKRAVAALAISVPRRP
ncbi:MAG TPA: acyltransferase [Vicinamibacterales bacterium]|nr:acyltransferase [Vicinamibacterales bacterium]